MQLTRLGIHESVDTVFPATELEAELSDEPYDVAVIGDDPDDVAACDGVVTFEHLDAYSTSVDWVHSIQAGYDRFPLDTFEENGVMLTNSTGIHGASVGETVVGFMLSFARQLHTYAVNQTRSEWAPPAWDAAFTLDGESVCVIGLGTLGRGVTERANALGMHVTGVRRSGEPVDGVETVHVPGDLEDAIADARFVVLATPLTPETTGMIGAEELTAMGDDAYLVNVARGPVVDESALVAALEAGEIAGAALDVFEEEPLPSSSPLWGMENVIVTPHRAALTVDYYRDVAALVREIAGQLRSGDAVTNRIL